MMSGSTRGMTGRSPLRVAVAGLWHLGSVAAGCLAELGHRVVGIDEDAHRVAALREGRAPLFEPDLDGLLGKGLASGRLSFTTDFSDGIPQADVVFVAYDTPVTDRDEVDLSVVMCAIERAIPLLKPSSLILVHSQVPVGTCGRIRERVRAVSSGDGCEVAYIPENLRLNQAIDRFLHPDMLVVGAEAQGAYGMVDGLLAGIDAPRVRTNLETAEMTKHALNAYLATSISFGNELANMCQLVGADASQVVAFLRLDRRVGSHVPIDPGMGFAGGTLARDVRSLQSLGRAHGYQPHLIDAVLRVNERQNFLPVMWLEKMFGALAGLHIGVLGLTYKTGTSTLRRSAAVEVVRHLTAKGALVTASDPKAELSDAGELPQFEFTRDPHRAVSGKDALVLMTPWPEFKTLDYERIRSEMRSPVVLDMQNALDRDHLEGLGFVYISVGRGRLASLRGA